MKKIAAVFIVAGLIGVVIWVVVFRKVPVVFSGEGEGVTVTVSGSQVKNGSIVGFGTKEVAVESSGKVPNRYQFNASPLDTLKISTNLRSLPAPEEISEGDFLRKDLKNQVFYRNQGRLYRADGRLGITGQQFGELNNIKFSPDGLLGWVKFSSGENGIFDFSRYNVLNQELTKWPNGIETAAWRPGSRASQPEKQRLIYLKDSVLYSSDPLHQNVNRLLDISSQAIKTAGINYSPDELTLLVVANGNLYLFDPQTKTLSKLVDGGVSSAKFSSDSRGLVYTKNSRIFYQLFSLANILTGTSQPADIGKISLGRNIDLDITGEAQNSDFDQSGILYVIDQNKIVSINPVTAEKQNVYHDQLPKGAAKLIIQGGLIYFEAQGKIYKLKLDTGQY